MFQKELTSPRKKNKTNNNNSKTLGIKWLSALDSRQVKTIVMLSRETF